MASTVKKDVLCDYCLTAKESNSIYTSKKVFAGRRLIDLLQNVSQREIPPNAVFHICNLCACTLMSTTVIVNRTQLIVDQTIKKTKTTPAAGRKKTIDNPLVVVEGSSDEADLVETENLPKANVSRRRNTIAFDSNGSLLKSIPTTEPASKILDENDLEDAVKLTPAKNVSQKKMSFIKLFGASETVNGLNSDTEEEEPPKKSPKKANKKLPTPEFECKLCDFQAKFAKHLKDHLKSVHNQQRPRIFNCPNCPKTFGVHKTLKEHIRDKHGIIQEEKKEKKETKKAKIQAEKEPEPQLVVGFKALNESVIKKKLFQNVENTEYTFQVDGTSASTPNKPGEPKQRVVEQFRCDICDSKLTGTKAMQDHMMIAHQVEKAKIFKCSQCDSRYSSKQSLKYHEAKHQNDDKTTEKRKENGEEVKEKKKLKMDKPEVSPDSPSKRMKLDKPVEALASPLTKLNDSKQEAASPSKTIKLVKVSQQASPSKLASPTKASPSKKSKLEKSKDVSTIDQNSTLDLDETIFASPFKKPKITQPDDNQPKSSTLLTETEDDTSFIDLAQDEINSQVKPHKKTLMQSYAESEGADEDTNISCGLCDRSFGSRTRLDSHVKKKHGKSLMCPICFSTYDCHLAYVAHFAHCQPSDQGLPCGHSKCKKGFKDTHYLSSHLKKKHLWGKGES